jgi:Ni,Fe-hydrogenase III small subunit/Pyruvate/2-oxoacid:ferredoxin oxidoreductase delta subunit
MLRLLSYLLGVGTVTKGQIPLLLENVASGLPMVTSAQCQSNCDACVKVCPTEAIQMTNGSIQLDRGACIGCTECLAVCPTGTLAPDLSTSTFANRREQLILPAISKPEPVAGGDSLFNGSFALRVVSTGCSACDLEVSAACNPIFDIDRFGVSVVASPRFADALLVTGPLPKAMHEPLRICYESMAAPKIVIACGTCAISGGVHKGGYAEANGVAAVLPVDVFIPGCAPHPWQIIQGVLAARKLKGSGS